MGDPVDLEGEGKSHGEADLFPGKGRCSTALCERKAGPGNRKERSFAKKGAPLPRRMGKRKRKRQKKKKRRGDLAH